MVNPENKMQQLFSAEAEAGVGLKICGMKYPENIIEVGSLLP
jgi:phosphoribosylanthranilate isomerase